MRQIAVFIFALCMFTPVSAFAATAKTNTKTTVSATTTNQLATSTVVALQERVVALEKEIVSLREQLSSKNKPSKCPVLTNTLSYGSTDAGTGGEVTALQQYLATQPDIYPEALVTGFYGTATEAAVKKLQKKNSIVSMGDANTTGYGTVGPATRKVIGKDCPDPASPQPPVALQPYTPVAPTAPNTSTTTSPLCTVPAPTPTTPVIGSPDTQTLKFSTATRLLLQAPRILLVNEQTQPTVALYEFSDCEGDADQVCTTWVSGETPVAVSWTVSDPNKASISSSVGEQTTIMGRRTGAVDLRATYVRGSTTLMATTSILVVDSLSGLQTFTGESICVERNPQGGSAPTICALGIKTTDGNVYHVLFSSHEDQVLFGRNVTVQGILEPPPMNAQYKSSGTIIVYKVL